MPGWSTLSLRLHRYALLFALLLFALVVQTSDVSSRTTTLWSDVSRSLVGIVALFVVFERRTERTAMAVVIVAAIFIGWTPYFVAGGIGRELSFALHALTAVYGSAAAIVIVRDLFTHPPVGAENILGAICGYMLAANAWGSINAFAYLLVPSSFDVAPGVMALLEDWRGRLALFGYYSYTQMMTIGYADVTPVRTPATLFSLLAALFGVFYTAVVVSQLVTFAQLVAYDRR